MYISQEKINKNYVLWLDYLKKYECYSEELVNDYGELIKNASFSLNESSGGAYQGALLDVVLSTLCVIASHINNDAFGENSSGNIKHKFLHVDKKSLMKVLLLQHISKADIFVSATEQWKINKGMLYEFNPSLKTSMKLGQRSLYICQKYGITFTEEEYEAMGICDKEEEKNSSFVTPISQIVKMANQLTAIELFNKNKKI